MRTLITNVRLMTPDVILPERVIVVEDHRIAAITSEAPRQADRVIDGNGLWAGPGLIDIHVHGGEGFDTMDANEMALHGMARFFARHGVTGFYPTTLTAPRSAIRAALESIRTCAPPPDGARLLGAHLEGPYLNLEQRGAQPETHLRLPDPGEYGEWLASGVVRLATVAPEQPGVMDFIYDGIQEGVRFALGHSAADYEQVIAAADAGLDQATHTFNGMGGLHHRRPGTVGGVLTDGRIYAQVIADGAHLHPAIVKLLVQAKGIGRTVLITDSMRAAGLPDGAYDLGGQMVTVTDGIARTAAGGLAGSTLTMDEAVRNIRDFTGVSLSRALAMASRVPAEAMGLATTKGTLRPGADADIILFDDNLNIQLTMVMGKVAYEKGTF